MEDSLAGQRILVVEDEYFTASDVRRSLAEKGAAVVGPAADPRRALSLAATEAIDAAVLDINLDGRMSYAVADRLAARGVPFLFLRGYDAWVLPDAYRAIPRLTKPHAMASLPAAVRQLILPVPA